MTTHVNSHVNNSTPNSSSSDESDQHHLNFDVSTSTTARHDMATANGIVDDHQPEVASLVAGVKKPSLVMEKNLYAVSSPSLSSGPDVNSVSTRKAK